jgi:hypothetical protein
MRATMAEDVVAAALARLRLFFFSQKAHYHPQENKS